MFTGLVEEIGIVKSVNNLGSGIEISVNAQIVTADLVIGDSININGACQTVVGFERGYFSVEAVEETIKKTSLGTLLPGDKVNLERSLTLNKKLGGHLVMGHTDTTGKVLNIRNLTNSYIVDISYPKEYADFIIHVGAIAVDGISLTIADFNDKFLSVSVIPHTWNSTIFQFKKTGAIVNLEFDILGKYVARVLKKDKTSVITEDWLKQNGF
jgi:riboflavin synthase